MTVQHRDNTHPLLNPLPQVGEEAKEVYVAPWITFTLNSIYLAEQEYKSNNGEYCISECSNNAGIIDKLFDGVDDLDGQKYTFKTTSADTLTIIATKIKDTSCTIKITQNIK